MILQRHKRHKPDFSLAMINIVFLLLMFFVLTGTVVKQVEIQIDAPKTKNLPLDKLPRPLLSIMANGDFLLEGQPINEAVVLTSMRNHVSTSPNAEPTINILADSTYPAQKTLGVIRALNTQQFSVKIVTLKQSGADTVRFP